MEIKVTIENNKLTIKTEEIIACKTINETEDVCKYFEKYIELLCKKIHFSKYRIDKTKNGYTVSKDVNGTRMSWKILKEFSNYFEAYDEIKRLEYKDECCPMGYCDCIWQDKDTELCKDCVSMNGYFYDDEDK